MNTFSLRNAVLLASIALAIHCHAGDEEDSKKSVIPIETPATSRWSVSAGVDVSSIRSSFRVDPGAVGLLDSGGGSTAIYNGTAEVFYRNGGVVGVGGVGGPTGGNGPGTTGFANPATFSFNPNNLVGFATFLGGSAVPLGNVSNTGPAIGPYIKLAYDAFDFSDPIHISPFIQYTFNTAYDSGSPALAVNNVVTSYSVNVDDSNVPFVIFNAAEYGFDQNPTQQTSTQFEFVNSGVNIDMHTFTLGLDFSKDLGDRVRLVLSTGPTLNLFCTDFSSQLVGLAATGPIYRNSEDTFCFGWVAELGVQYDLDSKKRWFLEAAGNYHWVTPFSVSTQFSSAEIDASSWGAKLGLGLHF